MKDWYYGLDERERLVVSVGAVAAVLIILWAGIWMPLDKSHRDAQNDVERWQRSLVDLRILGASMDGGAPTQTRPAVNTGGSPVVIVDTTLRRLELSAASTRPVPNGVRVDFESVAFDQLAIWIGEMSTTYGMEVQSGNLSITRDGGPGRINATLTLERAP